MFEKFRIPSEAGRIISSAGELADAERTLRHGLDGCGLGTDQTTPTGSSPWRTAAHDRCARCRERNLLSGANWLPMAPASAPVSPVGHGLLLLSMLGELWNLAAIAPGHLCTSACRGRARDVSECGDHGRPIGEDHGAWWHARLRRAQARERAQAPHPGGYTRAAGVQPSRASQSVRPTRGRSSPEWFESPVSTDPYGYRRCRT